MGIKTRKGNSWSRSPILKLLRNYAYTGNLILQTTYRENHITKRRVKNNGEKPMYHAQGSHEAIIDMDTFNRVQEEIQRRAEHFSSPDGNKSTTTYPFTSMVKCSQCGKSYVRSGSPKYRTWTCRTRREEGAKHCGAETIPEEELFRLTAEVVSGEVTEDAVRDKIMVIRVEKDCTLVFCLKNGKEIVKQWREHEIKYICTEEQKKQISLRNSGRKRTEKQKRQQSERMKEYWKNREFPEEQRKKQSVSMKAYWSDREASAEHREMLRQRMKEVRAMRKNGGKEENDG